MNNALTSTFALRVSFPGDFHICSSIYSVSIHYLTETGAAVQRCCSSHPKNQQQQKKHTKKAIRVNNKLHVNSTKQTTLAHDALGI